MSLVKKFGQSLNFKKWFKLILFRLLIKKKMLSFIYFFLRVVLNYKVIKSYLNLYFKFQIKFVLFLFILR